jgi:hypothetical protein
LMTFDFYTEPTPRWAKKFGRVINAMHVRPLGRRGVPAWCAGLALGTAHLRRAHLRRAHLPSGRAGRWRRLTPPPPSSPRVFPPTGSARRILGPGSCGSAPRAPRARLPPPRLPRASRRRPAAERWGLGAPGAPAARAGPGRPRSGRLAGPPWLSLPLPRPWPEIQKAGQVRGWWVCSSILS